MKIGLIVSVLFVATSARAQTQPLELRLDEAKKLYDDGERLRNVGKAMIWAGSVAVAIAIPLAAIGFGAEDDPGNRHGPAMASGGVSLLFTGSACLTLGIVNWALGRSGMNEAQRRGYVPYVAPLPGGGVTAGISVLRF